MYNAVINVKLLRNKIVCKQPNKKTKYGSQSTKTGTGGNEYGNNTAFF